jgi:hypothetical protein
MSEDEVTITLTHEELYHVKTAVFHFIHSETGKLYDQALMDTIKKKLRPSK